MAIRGAAGEAAEGPPPMSAWRRLPYPLRFLLTHAALGFGIAAVFLAGFLLADPGGGGQVLLTAAGHWWPAAMLGGVLGLGFGSVQIGIATGLLAEQPQRPGDRGRGYPVPVPVPVRRPRR